MIDEMIWALDSPGSVLKEHIVTLLSSDSTNARGADKGHNGNVPRVFYAVGRSELVGCGVRLGHLPAPSLQDESACAMPMPNYK